MHEKDIEKMWPSEVEDIDDGQGISENVGVSPNHDNPSSKIWSVYNAEVGPHDKALVESWKSDMDGILIFAGLFSASVTAFIVESYQTLKPDSGEQTVALLTKISQQLAGASNGSEAPVILLNFQPTSSALRVNACWFLSLCFGLSCALAATLVQQWSRSYLQAIERHPAPHKKARLRTYFYRGIESFRMAGVVDGIPTLLHISVFLFFGGLIDFLFAINDIMAYVTLAVVVACGTLYLTITVLPTIRRHCPYRTPLSGICWRFLKSLHLLRYTDVHGNYVHIGGSMAQGREMLAMQELPGNIERDTKALKWTVESLNEDNELQPFVEGISSFLSDHSRDSRLIIEGLVLDDDISLMHRIVTLLMTCENRGSLAEAARIRRAVACLNAIKSITVELDLSRWVQNRWRSPFWEDLGMVLQFCKDDEVPVIRAIATASNLCITSQIQSDIEGPTMSQNNHNHNNTSQSWRAVIALEHLNALDTIIYAVSTAKYSATSGLMRYVTLKIVPRYLAQLAINQNRQELRQPFMRSTGIVCLMVAHEGSDVVHPSIVMPLQDLKLGKDLDVRHIACCMIALIAYRMQNDIIASVFVDQSNFSFGCPRDCYAILHKMQITDVDAPTTAELVLNLRMGLTGPGEVPVERIRSLLADRKLQFQELVLDSLSQYDLEKLDEIQLRNEAQGPSWILEKILLHRGRISIMILVIQSIASLEIGGDTETLGFILETLTAIASKASARFSSHSVQRLLVSLIGEATDKMYPKPNPSSQERHHPNVGPQRDIISMLLNLLGTIGDPDLIDDAKKLLERELERDATYESAATALHQLITAEPLKPIEWR